MSNRSGWWLGLAALVLAGLLIACGTTYNPSSDGLVVVGSVGSSLLESFTFSLTNGHIAPITNSPNDTGNDTCVLSGGTPYAMVLDPAGQYVYAILSGNTACGNPNQNSIVSFKVNSDGTLAAPGTPVSDPSPLALAMDQSGKFLFVAEGLGQPTGAPSPIGPTQTPCISGTAQSGVCVYAIGSGGTLTPVQSTFNFVLPTGFNTPNFAALAPTPTKLPALVNGVQTAACSNPGNPAPTNEFLYAVDSVNNAVYVYGVDMSTGALTNPPGHSSVSVVQTGPTPAGVVVDACDRFVYVSDLQSNQISGFTLCSVVSNPGCPLADGSLQVIAGSPFSQTVGLGPGPMVGDPFGNYLYVLETRSNQVLPFQIKSVSGALSAGTAAGTGTMPISIAIRGDNNWLFVTNFTAATLSQFSIAPATGALSALPVVQTDNEPWGVVVK